MSGRAPRAGPANTPPASKEQPPEPFRASTVWGIKSKLNKWCGEGDAPSSSEWFGALDLGIRGIRRVLIGSAVKTVVAPNPQLFIRPTTHCHILMYPRVARIII